MDFNADTDRTARFVVPGDFVTMRENSNSIDGRTYDYVLPDPEDLILSCVTEVSRTDTGYWRQIIFEGTVGDCMDSIERQATTGLGTETINFRVYPDTEPPVLGVFFDMDVSFPREISAQKNGYITVRVNEAATDKGYAWEVPELDLECVDIVDRNYGGYTTGYVQYLFLAKDVGSFCSETISVTRSEAYTECPGCVEDILISVSTIEVADPTAAVTSIIDESDSEEVKAAK